MMSGFGIAFALGRMRSENRFSDHGNATHSNAGEMVMMKMVRFAAIATVAVMVYGDAGNVCQADEKTGTISGEISVSGVRSPENVLVYLENVKGDWKPPQDPPEIDQKKLIFIPRVLPVVKGTTVLFRNSDPVLHNVFWPKSADGSYAKKNLGSWGKGGTRKFKFDKEGSVVLLCNVHPDMEAHVVVLQNPFFALADKDGNYEIKDVPAGEYTVKTWYENPKKLKSKSEKATVKAGETAELDFSLSRR